MASPISCDLRPDAGLVVRVDVSMRHRFPFVWMFDEAMRPLDLKAIGADYAPMELDMITIRRVAALRRPR